MTTNRTRRWRALLAVVLVGAIALTSCGDNNSDDDASSGGGGGNDGGGGTEQTIRISSQDFAEQKTLAQVYGQYLEAKGFDVEIQDPIGTRTQIYAAFEADKLDLVLDYSGSAVTELKGEASNDAEETYSALEEALEPLELEAAAQAPGEDGNALVALTSWAEENDITTISDLSKFDDTITLGGAAECAEREDCLAGYNGPTYALGLEFKVVDYGPPLVEALKQDEIQVAQYGTTAPEIASGDIVVLEDDKGLQSAQNVVPVLRSEVSSEDLLAALDEVSEKITDEVLAEWNQATDIDKEDSADVAQAWLEDEGLI